MQKLPSKTSKGRITSFYLKAKIFVDITKLIDDWPSAQMNGCYEKSFLSPIFITADRNKRYKLAIDFTKSLIKLIHKVRHQLSKIDNLKD